MLSRQEDQLRSREFLNNCSSWRCSLTIPDAIKSTAGKHLQTRFWSFGRSSFKRRDDAQPQPHLGASCALDLPSCSLLPSTRLHYWPFRSSLYWATRRIFLASNHILPFHPSSSFQKALERHPATDQLIRRLRWRQASRQLLRSPSYATPILSVRHGH
jgi:hypothetical protein